MGKREWAKTWPLLYGIGSLMDSELLAGSALCSGEPTFNMKTGIAEVNITFNVVVRLPQQT